MRAVSHHHILSTFPKLNKKQQKAFLKNLDKDQTKFICEVCMNLLNGNIPTTDCEKKKLTNYKRKIRTLASRNSLREKKTIIQRGGFIPALLAAVGGTALNYILNEVVGE